LSRNGFPRRDACKVGKTKMRHARDSARMRETARERDALGALLLPLLLPLGKWLAEDARLSRLMRRGLARLT